MLRGHNQVLQSCHSHCHHIQLSDSHYSPSLDLETKDALVITKLPVQIMIPENECLPSGSTNPDLTKGRLGTAKKKIVLLLIGDLQNRS